MTTSIKGCQWKRTGRLELAADLRISRFALLIDRQKSWHRAQGSVAVQLRATWKQIPRSTKWNYQLLLTTPLTLAANSSRAHFTTVPLATDRSEPSGLSEPRIQFGRHRFLNKSLGQGVVADPALRSGQCGSLPLRELVPWTGLKNADLAGTIVGQDLGRFFDTVDSWEKYSQKSCIQTDLSGTPILGLPTSPNMGHAATYQALLPKPTKWPLRPLGTFGTPRLHSLPNMLDPSTLSSLFLSPQGLICLLCLRQCAQ
ncbi:hypothetical protein BS47DRAFT_1360432 [Hydnum rufescens UP504]|uniref:Uncharacterized protein n=1 Tax=Hydnum rufescens UP504 TaxID=1448309 RepID=A0A9P6B239_9AGAM|nr:hypothetical protein BS47DRAFT_1360432 [Hydnum rufescens UP504]